MRIDAVASIVFGAFSLYAVAAVLSRDRNGRRLALLTALFGIAYQLGELPLSVAMARETVAAAGPLLADIMAAGGEGAGRTQAELKAMLDATAARSALAAWLASAGACYCSSTSAVAAAASSTVSPVRLAAPAQAQGGW